MIVIFSNRKSTYLCVVYTIPGPHLMQKIKLNPGYLILQFLLHKKGRVQAGLGSYPSLLKLRLLETAKTEKKFSFCKTSQSHLAK